MKKVLFGTTALAAVAMAGVASAKDVSLGLGGYIRAGVAVSDFREQTGSDRNDASTGEVAEEVFHIIRDGEIHFKGKGTLDNGITIETRVELEAYGHDSDQIDENWLRISSSFGQIMIGANDDAAYNAGYVGMGYTAAPNFSWYDQTLTFVPSGDGGMFSLVGGSDVQGIHYYTPNIAGFSAGISYHPDAQTDAGNDAQASGGDNDDQIVAIGASYRNSFGDFDFALGGGFVTGDEDADTEQYGIGIEVGFSGFTLYGRYEDAEFGDQDAEGYTAGVSYETGPWSFGAGYGYQEFDGGTEAMKVSVGAGYALGDGVTVGAAVEYGDVEEDGGDDDSAFAGALLLGVSF